MPKPKQSVATVAMQAIRASSGIHFDEQAKTADAHLSTRPSIDQPSYQFPDGQNLLVDPSTTVMWPLANRLFFDEKSIRDLARSMREMGQQHTAVGRITKNGSSQSIEIIAGARRRLAAIQAGMPLSVRIVTATDKQAAEIMSAENEQRENISNYEMARDYARRLEIGLYTSARQLAEGINRSHTSIQNYLKLARLPMEIIQVYESPHAVGLKLGGKIVEYWERDTKRQPAILKAVKELRLLKLSSNEASRRLTTIMSGTSYDLSKGSPTKRYSDPSGVVNVLWKDKGMGKATLTISSKSNEVKRKIEAALKECGITLIKP